jgi:hypothetical protein
MPLPDERRSEVRWGMVRLVLGVLQMCGATTSLILLPQSAPVWLISASTGVTLLLTGVSRILFSPPKRQKGK